jgi:hypothetical protein
MAKCFKERAPRQAIGQASSACMAGVCVFLKLRCFGFYRTRCCILDAVSSSAKSQGKHRLKLRNMRIAQLQSANSGSWACSVLREIQLGGNHVETMVEYGRMLNTLRHQRSERSGRRIRL